MPLFATRVELHGATEADYNRLHSAMEQRGFSRIITSDDGLRYHLPTAEYLNDHASSIQSALDAAVQAASMTGRPAAVLVSEAQRLSWNNLPRAH